VWLKTIKLVENHQKKQYIPKQRFLNPKYTGWGGGGMWKEVVIAWFEVLP
jgi:hypothetical protein